LHSFGYLDILGRWVERRKKRLHVRVILSFTDENNCVSWITSLYDHFLVVTILRQR
jgi:hypothetical protein